MIINRRMRFTNKITGGGLKSGGFLFKSGKVGGNVHMQRHIDSLLNVIGFKITTTMNLQNACKNKRICRIYRNLFFDAWPQLLQPFSIFKSVLIQAGTCRHQRGNSTA